MWENLQVFGQFCPFNFLLGRFDQKVGPNFYVKQRSHKSWGWEEARSSGKGWMGKWSISMRISLRLIHLSILKYLVLSKLRKPKIWSRFADLINCASLRQHIFRHIFSQSEPFDVVFFSYFPHKKLLWLDIFYQIFLSLKILDTA